MWSKNAFSKIKPGSEKCSEIHIEEGKYEDENEDKDNDTTDNMNLNYMDNIDNLYKKAKLFYYFFYERKYNKRKWIYSYIIFIWWK